MGGDVPPPPRPTEADQGDWGRRAAGALTGSGQWIGGVLFVWFLLEVDAPLMLECQQATAMAGGVAADAPVKPQFPLQRQVEPAAARAVRVPYVAVLPRTLTVGLVVLGQLPAGVPHFLV